MVVLVPLIWGLLRKEQGLPMFGAPTVAELEDPEHAQTARAAVRVRKAAGPGPRSGQGRRWKRPLTTVAESTIASSS